MALRQNQNTKPIITYDRIQDQYIRSNFEALDSYFKTQNQLLDFKFFEVVFTEAQTGYKHAHELGYVPLDILVSRISGSGTVTFQYGQFDSTYVIMDVSGPCRIRFYVGTFSRLVSSAETKSTDEGEFRATLEVSGSSHPLYEFPELETSASRVRYDISTTNDTIAVDCTTGIKILNLPSASSFSQKQLWIVKTDSTFNEVSIRPSTTLETISGNTFFSLSTQYSRVLLYSTGTVWLVLDHSYPSEWTAYVPASYNGFGTPTGVDFLWRRQGDGIQIRGKLTLGTNTASEGRISIPTGLVTSSDIATIELAGYLVRAANSAGQHVLLMEPGVNYFTFGIQAGATSGLAKVNGNSFNNGDVLSLYTITIPISGWKG